MVKGLSAKILIVDDEPLNIDLLEQELEDLGYHVVSVGNGKDALAKVAADPPDLILLDVMMPELDGFTVCRMLKECEKTQLIPVVMMTALGARADRIKGIEAGADDFLTKPVNRRELLARIQTAVKMKQAVERRLKGPVVPDKAFQLEGEYWTIAYQGKVSRIRDTVGLHYLAYLLRYPHRKIHVLELVAAIENPPEDVQGSSAGKKEVSTSEAFNVRRGLGDAGELLDPQAKSAYKRRLEDLRAELEDAQEGNDLGRAAKAQREIEFLIQELRGAIGLGGRDRRAADVGERARVNVTRAMKAALQKIAEHHPALGSDLEETIHTGAYCSYMPDLRLPSPWQL